MTPEEIKAAQAKIDTRIAELKGYEGKTFKPINPLPQFKNQTIKILKYEGVGTLVGGVTAHLFRAESKNPGLIWTPPASKFLEEHEEITPEPETATPEII